MKLKGVVLVECVYCALSVFFCYWCTLCVPSVLWYCWLGLLTCKTVSHITYTVLAGT